MKTLYILVGSPGSGKTWVMNQLEEQYRVIPHDAHIDKDYLGAILSTLVNSGKPVLIETPFSMSKIVGPLEETGYRVEPVFIIEDNDTYVARYFAREGKEPPKGHLTRTQTYLQRARDGDHFYGTSSEVLAHLRDK